MSTRSRFESVKPSQASPKYGWGVLMDSLRQYMQPMEWRIPAPLPPRIREPKAEPEPSAPVPLAQPSFPDELPEDDALVATMATCIWYLKTKHFKRAWGDLDASDEDPLVRRSLGRINRVIDKLEKGNVELQDPTNERYPSGGEHTMRPIQFTPTAGVSFEVVTETVVPVIYRNDRKIQVGEVFVATPIEEDDESSAEGTPAHGADDGEAPPQPAETKTDEPSEPTTND
ncbi:MAG: hypothetical protein P1V81_06925 [Planctomycetota bacterium]|nr:hypothetical protein [Planctomycetota bacterium]